MSRQELTTTSYALLGLLAIRPWTPYELASQMDRSLKRFWPRARSKLYEEPKKLAALGLASAAPDAVGRRPRTVYTITSEGRRVLARWLSQPGEGPVLEFEQLMKIFFAEHGSKADALATLAHARDWAQLHIEQSQAIGRTYRAGTGPFPDRVPQQMLVVRFLDDFAELVDQWAQWAAGVVQGWPEDISAAEPEWAVVDDASGEAGAELSRPGS